MNQQFYYNSAQSTPSVPAVKRTSRLSGINQKQIDQMNEDVQLSRSLREEFEEMIEPSFFDRQFKRPLKFDARNNASYYRSTTSQLIKRAKSRNPTLKQSKSAGVFAFCQGSTMSFTSNKNSHIPAEYGGYDLQTYSTKLLSRLSSTEQSLESDQW